MDILVTGGTGFIGSALVRRLVRDGHKVRVFDNDFRGRADNLADILDQVTLVQGDIRVYDDVRHATDGVQAVYHLAYVNGTEYFYTKPRLVLDVAVRGQLNALDAAAECGVETFIYASSSETYQTPPVIPTPEQVPLVVPDVSNPRYSYGGGKLISELLLQHYAEKGTFRRICFRPHNVYGPAMGFEHVVPQLARKVWEASAGLSRKNTTIPIQGAGTETRAFCFVEDAVDGIVLAAEKGGDGEVFHVGVDEEISILDLISAIGASAGIDISVTPGPLMPGGTLRRCPDIGKLRGIGYAPKVSLAEGLSRTLPWYFQHFARS